MQAMRLNERLRTAVIGASVLLAGAVGAMAQDQINLTAGPSTAVLPDGSVVPMWGYSCGVPVPSSPASCRAANPNAGAGWSPVVITVPSGDTLQINLSDRLIFAGGPVPTSLVIVGQLGGGLGSPKSVASPVHDDQGTTWPIANTGPVFTPPAQGPRVRSFGTEVTPATAVKALTWKAMQPGTYLLESGTHPGIQVAMGLYGVVVVTQPATSTSPGTAYSNVSYNAEVPLIFGEIDPAQNNAVSAAVNTPGFNESATYGVQHGGPVAQINVINPGSNYTIAPKVSFSPAVQNPASATAVIDTDKTSPTFGQVTEIDITPNEPGSYTVAPTVTITRDPNDTPGIDATASSILALTPSMAKCSGGATACYPPVVNYSPRYYNINGVAFDKTNAAKSVFAATPAGSTGAPVSGNVLVRLVNAGLRMHVPALVGSTIGGKSGFGLVAEDGNPLPGVQRIQSEVFMAAGKTYDVMIDAPAVNNGSAPAVPVYDRELSLSGNAIARDAGMLAYIGVNGAGAPAAPGGGTAKANNDIYNAVIAGQTLTISDPSKGVIANDVNIYGVQIQAGGTAPQHGTVTLNADGTFKYQPNSDWPATTASNYSSFSDSFTYCGNGATTGAACATVTLNADAIESAGGISCPALTFNAATSKTIKVSAPGVLTGCKDGAGYPLSVSPGSVKNFAGTISVDASGAFRAAVAGPGPYTFMFSPQNAQGTVGSPVTITVNFPQGSGLNVTVLDGSDRKTTITDYRWILEEDRTFFVDPKCTTNPPPAGCPGAGTGVVPNFGTNFHTSFMPVIATGCTGDLSCGANQTVLGKTAATSSPSGPGDVPLCGAGLVDTAHCLDPNKRYYLSVLPGDAAQPFIAGYAGTPDCSAAGVKAGSCGHGMGGAPIAKGTHDSGQSITVYTEPSPYPPATLSVFVFEDDYPLNGEHDAGGGIDVLSPDEPGLGGFQITLADDAGGTGDATGTPTYDMFNMPLSNALAGTIDPVSTLDACPISPQITKNTTTGDGSQMGITGMIVTCPKYESDGSTLSPLAGQALVKNLYQGRYGVIANPGASRIAAGEEWLQTNTLDGQKAHDSFMRIGEPGYFQEFGPAGYHVTIGFANPKIINARLTDMCKTATDCTHEVKGHITTARMSRTPDERLYGSGTHDSYSFTQCYVSIGDPDGAEFGFTKCDGDGNFEFTGIPPGNWKVTTFDQWNDQVVDGITTPVGLGTGAVGDLVSGGAGYTAAPVVTVTAPSCSPLGTATCRQATAVATVDNGVVTGITFTDFGAGYTSAPTVTIAPPPTSTSGGTTATATATGSLGIDMREIAVHQWQSNIYTRTFLDTDFSGVSTDKKPGLPFVDTNIRFRDGSFSNFNNTDLNGYAGFNEVFPLFNWYVIETDSTRFKNTGTHVVYDAGGPVDGSTPGGKACATSSLTDSSAPKPCGTSSIAANLANTFEPNPLPSDLSVPGAVYCSMSDTADCNGESIAKGPKPSVGAGTGTSTMSTGRIDPAWVNSYGWQGYSGQNNFLEFGKKPFADGENGGIHGHVVYASTRPFDDPTLLLQLSWEPLVPHVRINLYQKGVAKDGVTSTLTLVDHTETTSFDDWAQGFRSDGKPNMNCPGQGTDGTLLADPYFWFALKGQPQYLDLYDNGTVTHALPYQSEFKCYDGMHNWNQLQPAPYDGMYSFPSVTSIDPVTGKPTGTNCDPNVCIANPSSTDPTSPNYDPYRAGTPMLPDGKYVVEVVVPEGYELVKEEDKNILIGDNYIAPATQQFGGLGSVFILPDQATLLDAYNSNNGQNSTTDLGRTTFPSKEADTGNVETYWPCVGAEHIVPDYISLFPGSNEVAPFAGATRHLCDRKEVNLQDQTSALAKFYIFTETHAASHFTGVITDDFTAEFDPYSPQFGEKYGPAYLPVSFKDWAGNEITRVYSDAWGAYNGLSYSTWEVNPPNPTGYGPTMMVGCMNDAGPVAGPNGTMVTDPLFQDGYSQFCYELPFMPAQTGYFDTPVVPTAAFAGGYNNPDCAYPDATPAISEVDGDTVGAGTASADNKGPWVAGAAGAVLSVSITNGGSGYSSAPSVTFGNPPAGGIQATGSAVISGSVTAVNLGDPTTNRGYSAQPTITFSGGGGSGAAATANMTNSVRSITITNGGVYSILASVNVTISGGGATTNATGTVNFQPIPFSLNKRVSSVTITNAGAGYTGTPTVTFSSGAAAGTANMGQSVKSVTLNSGGTGYTTPPTVSFVGAVQTGGLAAAASAPIAGQVSSVIVTGGGSGYTSAPSVSFSSGGGSGAAASASIETGGSLTILALGDQLVDNYEYSGPSASKAPYNQLKVTRHYSFGPTPTDFSTFAVGPNYSCNGVAGTTCPYVTIGGIPMTNVTWTSDGTKITGNVPSGVPACNLQQQAIYGGSTAQCGELSITTAAGKQSVDTVTVTIGGSAPTHVKPGTPLTASGFGGIQKAIDAANPGDLIIVDPGTYPEMLLMWKPVRLQGVGAATSIIDANTQPAGKLNPWRQRVVCLFGLALNGTPITGSNAYDPSGAQTCDSSMQFSVDRLPLEATVGWDATLNGNLAEQLIEPTLMGAYEGAGITVLAKGVKFPTGTNPFGSDVFPDGTQLLTASDCSDTTGKNPYPSNFLCNPSSIDGLGIKNSSQGGGGILVHAWGHNLQIANNRVSNNQGTLSGGITVGQGEHPDAYLVGGVATTVPGSCVLDTRGVQANTALPYCYDMDVHVHHNSVTQNSSLGDELFSSTPAGAGGVTFCNGSDYYRFNNNWVCGNMSTGDGAGVAHIGLSYDGDIEYNSIMFNESTNPTIVTNGGGLLVMGAPDADPPCGLVTDKDCVADPAGSVTPSDGTGPGLVINANLLLGNSADAGSGGGLRLQHVNGNEVLNFPNGAPTGFFGQPANVNWPLIPGHSGQPSFQTTTPWNAVSVTNNIIANNVAGWDDGGISLLDALATRIVNNTVVSNNSTASAGVLFQTLFAPLASTQGVNCTNGSQSCPQPAGLVSVMNSAVLVANMNQLAGGIGTIKCPTGNGANGSGADCTKASIPYLYNDLFWQNRSMIIGVGGLGAGFVNQQNTVTVYNPSFTGGQASAALGQTATGACNSTSSNLPSYWDIGVRGDLAPANHLSGVTLSPYYSVLTNTGTLAENGGGASDLDNPAATVVADYCNGSRSPVEASAGGAYVGWEVPPGTNESNALPAPPFTLMAAATVDEGNNWINLRWGPLSLSVPTTPGGATPFSFDPSLTPGSPAIGYIPPASAAWTAAPQLDYYGKPRKPTNLTTVDVGAIKFVPPNYPILAVSPTSLSFTSVVGTTSAPQTLTLTNSGGGAAAAINSITVTAPFQRAAAGGTCGTTLAAGTSCTINVQFVAPSTPTTVTGSVTISASVAVAGSPVSLTGTSVAAVQTATLTPSTYTFPNTIARNCPGLLCVLDPTTQFTLTNTGNVNLTVTNGGTLTAGNTADFAVRPLLPAFGATRCSSLPTLAPNASCVITVQFQPQTSDVFTGTTSTRTATLTVTDSFGTQTATVKGTER
ncbi:choice-of-anchor D domain-containing protein [Occallatibacter savannae]|uniref:choice-of-anchor D domain-containing protein n=1 Tax=Occallatibacter savannae TaxID=1002691 RepID=UPI000D692058|nr:choice-of-anchor D domain-containing protein [Occallatibacter savannae]